MNSFIAVLEKKVVSYMCFKGKHVEKNCVSNRNFNENELH